MAKSSGDVFSWDGMRCMLDEVLDEKLDQQLNEKLKDVVKKEDLNALKLELEAVKLDNNKLKSDNIKLIKEIKQLNSKMEMIDKKTRSANIVVNGIQQTTPQLAKNEFAKLCSEVLEVDLSINNTSIIGKNTIMFKLESSSAVQKVLDAKRKLKGRTIFIQRDYTAQEQHARYNQRQIVKKIKSKNRSLNVKLGEFNIFINDKKFSCKNDKVIAYSLEDSNFLKNLFEKCDCNIKIIVNDKPNNFSKQ